MAGLLHYLAMLKKNIPPEGTEIIDVAFQAPDSDSGEIK